MARGRLIPDLWPSFRALPLWVQLWMGLVLMPVNLASLAFLHQPLGIWVCVLAIGGMLPNLPLLILARGFTRVLALPHLPFWTMLVLLLLFAWPGGSKGYQAYLWVLLGVNVVSLIFDYRDAYRWWVERARS